MIFKKKICLPEIIRNLDFPVIIDKVLKESAKLVYVHKDATCTLYNKRVCSIALGLMIN